MTTTFHYGDFTAPSEDGTAGLNTLFYPEHRKTPRAIVQMAPTLIRPGLTVYTQSPALILMVMDLVMRGEVEKDAVALYEHRPDGTVEAVQWPCEANGYHLPTSPPDNLCRGLEGFFSVEAELTTSIFHETIRLWPPTPIPTVTWSDGRIYEPDFEPGSEPLVIHDEGDEPEDLG
jgi:hypothetical protein